MHGRDKLQRPRTSVTLLALLKKVSQTSMRFSAVIFSASLGGCATTERHPGPQAPNSCRLQATICRPRLSPSRMRSLLAPPSRSPFSSRLQSRRAAIPPSSDYKLVGSSLATRSAAISSVSNPPSQSSTRKSSLIWSNLSPRQLRWSHRRQLLPIKALMPTTRRWKALIFSSRSPSILSSSPAP